MQVAYWCFAGKFVEVFMPYFTTEFCREHGRNRNKLYDQRLEKFMALESMEHCNDCRESTSVIFNSILSKFRRLELATIMMAIEQGGRQVPTLLEELLSRKGVATRKSHFWLIESVATYNFGAVLVNGFLINCCDYESMIPSWREGEFQRNFLRMHSGEVLATPERLAIVRRIFLDFVPFVWPPDTLRTCHDCLRVQQAVFGGDFLV